MIEKYRTKKKRFIYRAIVGLGMLGYAVWHWILDGEYEPVLDQILLTIAGIMLGIMVARLVYRRIDSQNLRSGMTTLVFLLIAGTGVWLANSDVVTFAAIVLWTLTAILLTIVSAVRYIKA